MEFREDLEGVDWPALKQALAADRFDNGRTPEQLRRSFENSGRVVIVHCDGRVIATARAITDGVCNACIVDVWTDSAYRYLGIARMAMEILMSRLEGQHVALFTSDAAGFYAQLGFEEERVGMSRVVGQWLMNDSRGDPRV